MADWYFRNPQGRQRNSVASCPGCRRLVKDGEEFCPYCAHRLRPESGVRGWLRSQAKREYAVTRSILWALAAIFVLEFLVDLALPARPTGGGGLLNLFGADGITLILLGSNWPPLVWGEGQIWRLATYMFLHAGILHIVFNSWAFWDLGRLAEKLWGGRRLFVVFIGSGIAGGVASSLWNSAAMGRSVNSVGASGAVCGVLGLLLGAYYRNRHQVGELLGRQLQQWAVMIIVFGLLVGGIDNGAHIGGLVSGGAAGYFLRPTAHRGTIVLGEERLWTALCCAALVLTLASMAFAAAFLIANRP